MEEENIQQMDENYKDENQFYTDAPSELKTHTFLPTSKFSKFIILGSVVISVVLGYLGVLLHLTDPCPGCGIGGVVLIPFYVAAIPVLPAVGLMSLLPLDSSSYSRVLESYSLIKLIPIWLIFFNAFVFGYLLAFLSTKFLARVQLRLKNIPRKHYLVRPIPLALCFLATFLLSATVYSGYVLLKYPVVPNVDEGKLLIKMEPYIFYKYPNCEGEITPYTYPFKFSSPELDDCVLDNFMADNPYKDISVSGVWSGGPKDGRYSGTGYLDFFSSQTESMSQAELREFCDSFSPTPAPTTLIGNGLPLTYVCELELGVTPRDDLSEDYCKLMLDYASWYGAPVQNACLQEFVHMKPIQIEDDLFDDRYPRGWELKNPKLQLGEGSDYGFIDTVLYRKIIITKGVAFAAGSIWDEIVIYQRPINSPENRFIDTFSYKQLDYTGSLKRVDVETFKTKNGNVYIEHMLDEESGDDYMYVHFLTKDSYVTIKGQKTKLRDLSEEETREVLLEVAYHILDVVPEESVLEVKEQNSPNLEKTS